MDVKELNKKQLILLTLLITFVVSIATGIVTVSLMNQMPKSVPQTINNVIQRTIEKVTTVQVPTPAKTDSKSSDSSATTTPVTNDQSPTFSDSGDTLIPLYLDSTDLSSLTVTPITENQSSSTSTVDQTATSNTASTVKPESIGDGVIVSDVGLVLVDSNIISNNLKYKIVLNKTIFNASILKRFDNGFTIMKISPLNPPSTDSSVNTTQTSNQ